MPQTTTATKPTLSQRLKEGEGTKNSLRDYFQAGVVQTPAGTRVHPTSLMTGNQASNLRKAIGRRPPAAKPVSLRERIGSLADEYGMPASDLLKSPSTKLQALKQAGGSVESDYYAPGIATRSTARPTSGKWSLARAMRKGKARSQFASPEERRAAITARAQRKAGERQTRIAARKLILQGVPPVAATAIASGQDPTMAMLSEQASRGDRSAMGLMARLTEGKAGREHSLSLQDRMDARADADRTSRETIAGMTPSDPLADAKSELLGAEADHWRAKTAAFQEAAAEGSPEQRDLRTRRFSLIGPRRDNGRVNIQDMENVVDQLMAIADPDEREQAMLAMGVTLGDIQEFMRETEHPSMFDGMLSSVSSDAKRRVEARDKRRQFVQDTILPGRIARTARLAHGQ